MASRTDTHSAVNSVRSGRGYHQYSTTASAAATHNAALVTDFKRGDESAFGTILTR